jgi:2-dehydropantoate 2-reductase
MSDGDHLRLAGNRDTIVLMIRAIREGYRVLQELDIPIAPAKHRIFKWVPEAILVELIKRVFKSDEMADLVGHAHAARDEMKQIADEFMILARSTSVQTPAMDRLYKTLDQGIHPIVESGTE